MPFVSPVTVHEVVAVVQVKPPGDEVTVEPVIALPPLDTGAVQETSAEESPNTPDTPVGAPGTVAGVTAPEALDATPVPAALVAVTVNVYEVPFVRPVTVHVVAVVVQVNEPGDEVTVYPVIVLPPLLEGAVQETTTCVLPNTPDTPVGAPGTVAGMIAVEAEDAAPVPAAFVAVTVNV